MNNSRKKKGAPEQQRARWRGKNYERRVAELLGGVVVGRSKAVKVGSGFIEIDPNHPPDVITRLLSIECKHTKIPASIRRAIAQAERNAPKGKTPLVFWGDREGQNLVIMNEDIFMSVYQPVNNPVGSVSL